MYYVEGLFRVQRSAKVQGIEVMGLLTITILWAIFKGENHSDNVGQIDIEQGIAPLLTKTALCIEEVG